MSTIPYAVVINFSLSVIWGKIGPFRSWDEASRWSSKFRIEAASQKHDITAIPGNVLGEIQKDILSRDYLPSRDPKEIITHAAPAALVGLIPR